MQSGHGHSSLSSIAGGCKWTACLFTSECHPIRSATWDDSGCEHTHVCWHPPLHRRQLMVQSVCPERWRDPRLSRQICWWSLPVSKGPSCSIYLALKSWMDVTGPTVCLLSECHPIRSATSDVGRCEHTHVRWHPPLHSRQWMVRLVCPERQRDPRLSRQIHWRSLPVSKEH